MARDPLNPSPASLDDSPHLRDLSLTPSTVKNARPVIIHPQLRDLILPLERGRVYYPTTNAIEELTWKARDEDRDEVDQEMGEDEERSKEESQQTRMLTRLMFTPNCLIANKTMMAAGGQHGELYVTNVPPRTGINATAVENKLAARFPPRPIPHFTISAKMPNHSINNSMILLPTYPHDWNRHSDERRIGNKTFRMGDPHSRSPEDLEDVDREEVDMDDIEEMDDEAMDFDEEEEDQVDEEMAEAPQSPLTYPNTVPFLHAPRIPQLPNRQSSDWMSSGSARPSRRAASFSDRLEPRYAGGGGSQRPSGRMERQSFSIPRPGTGLPPIEYVTSIPMSIPGSPSARSNTSSRHQPKRNLTGRLKGRDPRMENVVDEPRLLISNNDLSVKMFALRPTSAPNRSSNPNASPGPNHIRPNSRQSYISMLTQAQDQAHAVTEGHIGRFGVGVSIIGDRPHDGTIRIDTLNPRGVLGQDIRAESRRAREVYERQRSEFQRIVGMPVTRPASAVGAGGGSADAYLASLVANAGSNAGARDALLASLGSFPPAGAGAGAGNADALMASLGSSLPTPPVPRTEERTLVRIGGSKFKCAINHSSLSPDLKNMVSVGDSEEVYLFEVVDGGKEFRKVATYKGATDSGFSTAWSRDGRKFAVASQDGQVTVWDHRSSIPMAKFYSSLGPSPHSDPPSFSSDLHMSRNDPTTRAPMLVDPVTGFPRMGVSNSGREAARVVKFSPEGAPRDLLVFSEENTNIHIIDAQTLNSHVTIPVPYHIPYPTSSSTSSDFQPGQPGTGTESWARGGHGQSGISGIAFDPTGEWLYSGTERTVVEWDMRGEGRAGMGVWDLA